VGDPWEPDRPSIFHNPPQSQRLCVMDQRAQDAFAHGERTDGASLLRGDPHRDELADPAGGTEHTQCAIPGPGQLDRQLNNSLQNRR
jgi:hypothetical protein